MKRALIVSDGKPGHVNQSIALCSYLNLSPAILEVRYRSRAKKTFSYLLDRLNIYSEALFSNPLDIPKEAPAAIVATGSTTYYAAKLLARKLCTPSIAILYPNGYRLNFSHILCPAYDHPPKQPHIIELPLNLCHASSSFFEQAQKEFAKRHTAKKPAVGVIIGGPNAISTIDPDALKQQLKQLFELTPEREHWVTTSRRTPPEIEALVEQFPFDYTLINSRDTYNPIPAFIDRCERIFLTSDSASMMSECASFGRAFIEILLNRQLKTPNKFEAFIRQLEAENAAHLFDGSLGESNQKIQLAPHLLPLKKIITGAD